MKWYVIHSKIRQEFRAFENLQVQGFEVFLPACQVQKKSQGKIKIAIEPLFSRYLFIRLSDVSSNWSPIRSTRGVSQLVKFGVLTEPIIVPDSIIEALQQRCVETEPLHELFKKDDLLEITQGPFKGFTGFFEKLQTLADGSIRAILLVEVLGSLQKLRLSVQEVTKHRS